MRIFTFNIILISFSFIVSNFLFGKELNRDSYINLNVNDASDEISLVFDVIPKKIWQTYKTKKLPTLAFRAQKFWVKNQQFEYALFDDQDIENYILQNWTDDMHFFYKSLPIGVMKADLWRYLILATEGGIYSDIDSVLCKKLHTWEVPGIKNQTHVLLLGLENDCSFCQWTIAATKMHPAVRYACDYILEKFLISGIDMTNPHVVHATTGPSVWTEALKSYMGIDSQISVIEIYNAYKSDRIFRAYINRLGIWLFPEKTFAGLWTRNLYGSQNFGGGYVHWIDEVSSLVPK